MRFLLPLIAVVLATPAAAQWPASVEKRLTRTYNDCMASGEAARGQTLAMNNCTGAEIERQDGRLNQAYVTVMKRLPAKRKAALRTSERAWIAKRDRTCQAAADRLGGGSGAGLEYGQCVLRETIARTLWLEDYG